MSKHRYPYVALLTLLVLAAIISDCPGRISSVAAQETPRISQRALRQIEALNAEKDSRTPAQQKIDSQFLYALKRNRGELTAAFETMVSAAAIDANGRVLVDISAQVTPELLANIKTLGGEVLSSYEEFKAIQARVPLESLEALAESDAVNWIGPADQAMTNREVSVSKPRPRGSLNDRLARVRTQLLKALPAGAGNSVPNSAFIGVATSEGDIAHQADIVRNAGFNGTGIRIGVLSDSYNTASLVDWAQADVAKGDLPGPGNPFGNTTAVTVVQDLGSGGTDEGRAMLHLIHDLAPGAQLFFATGVISQAAFAANIITLRETYNCQIIVDDITYYSEGVFQDDIIAQAVNTVTDAGALYFSSAGNSGNLNDQTSGVWEGDFNDGGKIGLIPGGTVHDFGGGALSNLINKTGGGSRPISLKWSDPLGASDNDYDLYILNGDLTTVVASSTNTQSGTQNPLESIANTGMVFKAGDRIVILRRTGEALRALHLNSNRGQLAIATSGVTFGHNAAGSGFCVAAVDVATAKGGVFSGGAANPVEKFSSDGLRRIFFKPGGDAITPGNLLFGTNGGQVFQKPDMAAADGAATNVLWFETFFGTSAAAPHAGAVAALVWSSNLALTAAQVRTALTSTALDIEAAGVDRDSGFGIVMAFEALASMMPISDLRITKQVAPDPVTSGNNMSITLEVTNQGPSTATNVVVTDNLPATTTFVSCVSTLGGICGGAGNNRTVTFASVAVNATAHVTIGATANCNVTSGTVVLNNASVTGSQPDPVPATNSSSDSTTVSNPPPEITCPSDIDTFSDPGKLYATLNPDTPIGTDTGGCPVVVTGTRSDGKPLTATYPVGTTSIEWKATDASNQMVTCVQTIKVRTIADVRVVINPLTDPAKFGKLLTYMVETTNYGPSSALGVGLTDNIAMDQLLVSVTEGPGVGSCRYSEATRVMRCDMGQIDHSNTKYVLITVKPQFKGQTSNQASASVSPILTVDPKMTNNTVTKYTNVLP